MLKNNKHECRYIDKLNFTKKKVSLKTMVLFGIFCSIISAGIGVAAIKLVASDIVFKSNYEDWTATNVEAAMNDLYKKINDNDAVTGTFTGLSGTVDLGFKPTQVIFLASYSTPAGSTGLVSIQSNGELKYGYKIWNGQLYTNYGSITITDTGFDYVVDSTGSAASGRYVAY